MNSVNHEQPGQIDWLSFSKNVSRYQNSSAIRGIWQIVNTLIPYLALWALIILSLSISLWLTAFLIILAAAFLVRLFIIFHDCGHGSFFNSLTANKTVGILLGILAFTPYNKWHNQHLKHHATVGNLDKRGVGDVWTMTKKEYESANQLTRIKYRLYRNPFVMFGLGPLFVFLIQNRFNRAESSKKEKMNVYFTNVAILLLVMLMGYTIGFSTYLIIQLLILDIAAISGLWLFYLQHQYEDVAWFRNDEWDYRKVALQGSSFVKFPALLRWFSGNIGYHHIHHLNARIPNYYLAKAYRENALFKGVKPVTFFRSMRSLKLRLWDENLKKMVSFRSLRLT